MRYKCKHCKARWEYWEQLVFWVYSFCSKECIQSYQKETKKPITQRKAINKISLKKKQRIKEWWSEVELFREILIERQDNWLLTCEICNKQFSIEQAQPVCLAHILSKWQYKALRLFKNNIAIVCPDLNTKSCHTKLDSLVTWNKKQIEQKILNWEMINLNKLVNY